MRVVVIGSNSFSGSDFIDLLLDERDVDVIGVSRSPEKSAVFLPYRRRVRPNFTFRQLDLNTQMPDLLALLDSFEPEYVVTFAAQSEVAPSWDHPEHWFQTNVVALARLANHLRGRPYLRRYVHISSPEVYGTCVGVVTESAPLNPSTPYAASKAAADLFLATLARQFDFPVITIRATNVYGPHQQLWKVIPRSVIHLRLGNKIPLHGGGLAVKSYIHVRDVSRGELAAMELGRPGQIYHLSPDGGFEVRDVVRRVCDLMGESFEARTTVVDERLGQDRAYVIDSSRARNELRWHPQVDLIDGLGEVVHWIDANWASIRDAAVEYVHQP